MNENLREGGSRIGEGRERRERGEGREGDRRMKGREGKIRGGRV